MYPILYTGSFRSARGNSAHKTAAGAGQPIPREKNEGASRNRLGNNGKSQTHNRNIMVNYWQLGKKKQLPIEKVGLILSTIRIQSITLGYGLSGWLKRLAERNVQATIRNRVSFHRKKERLAAVAWSSAEFYPLNAFVFLR